MLGNLLRDRYPIRSLLGREAGRRTFLATDLKTRSRGCTSACFVGLSSGKKNSSVLGLIVRLSNLSSAPHRDAPRRGFLQLGLEPCPLSISERSRLVVPALGLLSHPLSAAAPHRDRTSATKYPAVLQSFPATRSTPSNLV